MVLNRHQLEPTDHVVRATNGDFYGTTLSGGNLLCAGEGCGTVFKITPSGTFTRLYSFCSQSNCTDGVGPFAGLVLATNGDFYGTTNGGGANCIPHGGCGTVFKITPSGTLTTLYSFCPQGGACSDGSGLYAGLVQATDRNLYGTTGGGGNAGDGTVFKITPSGTLTTLYSFCSQANCTDGAFPYYAGLVQATDGNFYGTTLDGGANKNSGTVFKITPSGTLTTLYNFCSEITSQNICSDGYYAAEGLVQDTNGKLYGSTVNGGANDQGTIFSLSVALSAFVQTLPTSGKVGATVYVLGTNLTGTTNVSFGGTSATFTVVSATEIKASVPSNALTGSVSASRNCTYFRNHGPPQSSRDPCACAHGSRRSSPRMLPGRIRSGQPSIAGSQGMATWPGHAPRIMSSQVHSPSRSSRS